MDTEYQSLKPTACNDYTALANLQVHGIELF